MSRIYAIYSFFVTCLLIRCNSIIVKTNYGEVEGEMNAYNVNQFKKIPFAKPPIDHLRWQAPEQPDPWEPDILNAKEQDVPACLQGCFPGKCEGESEDCLYLNIFTPHDAKCGDTNYAVMIFLFGGSFDRGENDKVQYNPSNIIKNIGDIIIVIPHYRLGIMGFLYDNTFNTGINGNYGIQDQSLAIKWVHENIEYFGGNKKNIALFGQSAGAQSVAIHLLYNDEYITSAIMQSPILPLPFRNPITWYDIPHSFTELIGCNATQLESSTDLLNCWKSVSASDILQVQIDESYFTGEFGENWPWNVYWTPTIQTDMIPNDPIFEWQNSNKKTKPFMIGTNKDEYFWKIDESHKAYYNYDFLKNALNYMIGNDDIIDQIFDFYGINNNNTYSDNYLYDFGAILNDNWICSIRNVLSNIPMSQKAYYYNFDVINEKLFTNVIWDSDSDKVPCHTRTCHGTDVYYVFTAPEYTDNNMFDNDTLKIGQEMQILWTNFAKKQDPNGKFKMWPTYKNHKDKQGNFLRISDVDKFDAMSTYEYDPSYCKFWDQIGYAGVYTTATDMTMTAENYNPCVEAADDENGKLDRSKHGNIVEFFRNINSWNKTDGRIFILLIFGISVLFNVTFIGIYCWCVRPKKIKFHFVGDTDDETNTEESDVENEPMQPL